MFKEIFSSLMLILLDMMNTFAFSGLRFIFFVVEWNKQKKHPRPKIN